MSRSTTLVVAIVLWIATAASVRAQAPADTAAVLDSVARQVTRLGAAHGSSIWPGYRPDTIPLSFVLPDHGDFLFHWRGPLPEGYQPVSGIAGAGWRDLRALGAASTGTELGGRPVAQVVVNSADGAALTAVAFHEALHVYQNALRQEGQSFGRRENAFYVASYPVFDAGNEAGMALEGRILAAALDAGPAEARVLVRQFVAVRRARQQGLGPEYAEFEQAAELNEGLAQYAQVRALEMIAAEGPAGWRRSAESQLATERARLRNLTDDGAQSFRLRFYASGPAVALLLDRLAPGWKAALMTSDQTLQDALGAASGLDSAAIAARGRAERQFGAAQLRVRADSAVNRLMAMRRRQVDSLLARPGLLLVVRADSLPGRDFGNCGFDPQNHLQISPTMQLQTRWWKPCGGGATMEFNLPSVHDGEAGTVSAVLGPDSLVKLSAGGEPLNLGDREHRTGVEALRIDAPRASVEVRRADLLRQGRRLVVVPRP